MSYLQEFCKTIYEINPFIEIIGTYVKSNVKVSVRCKKCGVIPSRSDRITRSLLGGIRAAPTACARLSPRHLE